MGDRRKGCLCSNICFMCIENFLSQSGCIKTSHNRRWPEDGSGSNLAKASWPIPSVEALFLPHFKLSHDVKSMNIKIVRLLSKGAFGAVYEIISTKSQEKWAMKVLDKSKILENNCVRQVKTEVEIQRAVGHHTFISSTPRFWQTKPLLFIMFELANHGDLHEFCIKFGPLPEELCRIYIAQIGLAVEFLHEAGVIHRDVKPENVLLDSSFNIKLSDFGLAKWLPQGPNHRTYTMCGTAYYIAPEVLLGEGYGHAADWWSVGQLASFLHTLKVLEYKAKIESVSDGLSSQAKDLLSRILISDPKTRLRSFRQLTTIPYYHLFNFESLRNKQMDPKLVVEKFASSALSKDTQHPTYCDQTYKDLDKFDFF